jgi:hypothetical protein
VTHDLLPQVHLHQRLPLPPRTAGSDKRPEIVAKRDTSKDRLLGRRAVVELARFFDNR